MVKHSIRFSALAAALVLVAGCQEDLTPEKKSWDAQSKEFATKLEGLKKTHEALASKVRAFEPPAGDEAVAKAKAAVEAKLTAEGAAVAAVEKALIAGKTAYDSACAAGKKDAVAAATESTKASVRPALTKAMDTIEANTKAFAELEKQAADGEAAAAKEKKEKAEKIAEAAAIVQTLKNKGARVELAGIAFKAGAADLDAEKAESKAELAKLLSYFKTCPQLKAGFSASMVGTAKDLKAKAAKRAAALKKWLTANGVDAKRVGKVEGAASKAGSEKVTLTIEKACK